jgi:hypothetical protein
VSPLVGSTAVANRSLDDIIDALMYIESNGNPEVMVGTYSSSRGVVIMLSTIVGLELQGELMSRLRLTPAHTADSL